MSLRVDVSIKVSSANGQLLVAGAHRGSMVRSSRAWQEDMTPEQAHDERVSAGVRITALVREALDDVTQQLIEDSDGYREDAS